MMKWIVAVVLGLSAGMVSAQNDGLPDLAINSSSYKTAIGLRGGGTSGLTIKQFVGGQNALEGIIGVWHHGFTGTLMYERYASAFNVSGLNWYYGAGGHVAFETARIYEHHHGHSHWGHRHYSDGGVGLGVDGIMGIEYKIPTAPFAISLDVKPFIEVNTRGGVWGSMDPGLGIKVVF